MVHLIDGKLVSIRCRVSPVTRSNWNIARLDKERLLKNWTGYRKNHRLIEKLIENPVYFHLVDEFVMAERWLEQQIWKYGGTVNPKSLP